MQRIARVALALPVALFAVFVVGTVANAALGAAVALTTNTNAGGLLARGSVQTGASLRAVEAELARGTLVLALVSRITWCAGVSRLLVLLVSPVLLIHKQENYSIPLALP